MRKLALDGGLAVEACRACMILWFQGEELRGEFYAVNLACLDDATPQELAAAPVRFEDGRNDRWDVAPAETRHL